NLTPPTHLPHPVTQQHQSHPTSQFFAYPPLFPSPCAVPDVGASTATCSARRRVYPCSRVARNCGSHSHSFARPWSRDTPCASRRDRKSTRLNSSHVSISYAVYCLKKNRQQEPYDQ